jgi:hypothetical protein
MLSVAGKSALTTGAISLLTPALGAQTAATIAAAAPIALFVAGFAAIAIALKSLTDATAQSVERINVFAESQRTLSDKIASGLTSDEARKELEELNTRRKLEADTLNTLQAAYDKSTQQLKQATIGGISLGNAFDNISKIVSQDEQALADQIAKSQEVYKSTEGDVTALTAALEDGSLAANDAAIAEKRLADERSKSAISSADAAGKELAAQQKADAATGEQNEKRLQSITDETAVIQAQIDSLTASGVTSEDVTAKIAALTSQLGLLGKESEYISGTALAAAKARDAEKKAAADQKKALEEAARAQEQQAKAIKSATTTYKQSVQDIGTRLTQTLADNRTKFERDLIGLTVKNQQDEYDLQLKGNRAERDAALDQIDDLDKLRKDARKSEQEALREGDFKQLFLSRESAKEAATEQQDELNKERERRALSQRDALEDLRLNFERQRNLRKQGYEYSNTDAQTAQQRELRQAMVTRQRALQVASEGMNAELRMRQNFWNAAVNQTQNALNQITGMQGRGPNMPANGPKAFSFTAGLAKVIGT